MRYRLISFLALAALILPSVALSKLYKWVDENGKVHYSDRVPPEAARLEREVKTETGVTVEKIDAAKSREQLEAERQAREQEEARRRAEEAAAREQAEKDRILLLTFSSLSEMERARNDRVAALNGRIRLTQSQLEKLQSQLDGAKRQAADAERSGRGTPADMHKRIQDLERQIADRNNLIRQTEAERDAIVERFDHDMARYQELMAKKDAAPAR